MKFSFALGVFFRFNIFNSIFSEYFSHIGHRPRLKSIICNIEVVLLLSLSLLALLFLFLHIAALPASLLSIAATSVHVFVFASSFTRGRMRSHRVVRDSLISGRAPGRCSTTSRCRTFRCRHWTMRRCSCRRWMCHSGCGARSRHLSLDCHLQSNI